MRSQRGDATDSKSEAHVARDSHKGSAKQRRRRLRQENGNALDRQEEPEAAKPRKTFRKEDIASFQKTNPVLIFQFLKG